MGQMLSPQVSLVTAIPKANNKPPIRVVLQELQKSNISSDQLNLMSAKLKKYSGNKPEKYEAV